MLTQIIVSALKEDRAERLGSLAHNGVWAVVCGVTFADADELGRGRGWMKGVGDWKMPLFSRHPLPVWITAYLRVRLPRFMETDSGFIGPDGDPIGMTQEVFNLKLAGQQLSRSLEDFDNTNFRTLVEERPKVLFVFDSELDEWDDPPITQGW